MKIKDVKKAGTITGVIAVILVIFAIMATNWIITCGILKLITMCFGWTFSWAWATGIWLLMSLLRGIFSNNTTIKK